MPSTSEPSSILGGWLPGDALLNPWNWVALIYAIQTLGAFIAIHLLAISFAKVALPVGFLVLGFAVALVFRRYDTNSRIGCWKWWIPVIIYALVVFLLSHRSYPEASSAVDTKLFHPLEYLTLGILLSGAWHGLLRQLGRFGFACCVQLSGTAYAFSDELHQAFIPGRTPALTDVLIDSVGIALGWGIFLLAGFIVQAGEKRRPVLQKEQSLASSG